MSVKIITPKDKDIENYDFSIFLAGSIEMGKARHWQDIVVDSFKKQYKDYSKQLDWIFFNPYLKDWDNTIGNTIKDKKFYHQVSWEWEHLLKSDLVVFNFEPETKSPISMLELGAMASLEKKIVVCCPKKFWKIGNIEFIADYYSIPLVEDLSDIPQHILNELCK